MTSAPTDARHLLWRAISQCAGARWHSLSILELPTPAYPEREDTRITELVRQIQKRALRWLSLEPADSAREAQGSMPCAAGDLHVEIAFQYLQLATQRLLLGEGETARAHCLLFLHGLLAGAVEILGAAFAPEEREPILAAAQHLPGRLAAQLELRLSIRSGALSNRLIFVLGMHRSGTSALSGMLCQAGLDAPRDLMPAQLHNPLGYWESIGMYSLNEELLRANNTSWSGSNKLPLGWKDDPGTESWRRRILHHLERVFAGARMPVIKDPRFCLLLEGVSPWLESGWIKSYMILILRDPFEVASSLHAAEGIPLQAGLQLWLHHVLDAELQSRAHPRILIRFEELISHSERCLLRCLDLLDDRLPYTDMQSGINHITADLHRQRRCKLDEEIRMLTAKSPHIANLAMNLFELLNTADVNTTETMATLDNLSSRWRLLPQEISPPEPL